MLVKVPVATEAEARNRLLRQDIKNFLRLLRLPFRGALEALYERAGRADRIILDKQGNRVELVEPSDADLNAFDYWYRDWIATDEVHAEPRLRRESTHRIILLITLLRMIFPKESLTWGKPLVVLQIQLAP